MLSHRAGFPHAVDGGRRPAGSCPARADGRRLCGCHRDPDRGVCRRLWRAVHRGDGRGGGAAGLTAAGLANGNSSPHVGDAAPHLWRVRRGPRLLHPPRHLHRTAVLPRRPRPGRGRPRGDGRPRAERRADPLQPPEGHRVRPAGQGVPHRVRGHADELRAGPGGAAPVHRRAAGLRDARRGGRPAGPGDDDGGRGLVPGPGQHARDPRRRSRFSSTPPSAWPSSISTSAAARRGSTSKRGSRASRAAHRPTPAPPVEDRGGGGGAPGGRGGVRERLGRPARSARRPRPTLLSSRW